MPENNLTNMFQGGAADEVITYNRDHIIANIGETILAAINQETDIYNEVPADVNHPLFTRDMVEDAPVRAVAEDPCCYKNIYSEEEFEDEILFSKDGKQVGKLTIDNTRITFEGDADESALQFFNSLRHVNGTYIRKLHKALEAYRDIPVNGEYMAEYALQMINNPYPLEIEKRLCL